MNPFAIAATVLGVGVGVAVISGRGRTSRAPAKGLLKRFPDAVLDAGKQIKTPGPGGFLNPDVNLPGGTLSALPDLPSLAAVVAQARAPGPLDGDDDMGGGYKDPFTSSSYLNAKGLEAIVIWGDGLVSEGSAGLVHDPALARQELFQALLEAIEVGLDRMTTSDPRQVLIDGEDGRHSGEIIAWALAYMVSPAHGDLGSRVSQMVSALERLITRPTISQYIDGQIFDTTWMKAAQGISQATGKQSLGAASEALFAGPTGYMVWQHVRGLELQLLFHDWRTYFGDPALTIETASTVQLMNLAVSLGVQYFDAAAQKTCNWPAGPPSKVDTWGNILKALSATFTAGVAAFSGNYIGVLNTALTAADKAPLPEKVGAILEGAGDSLTSWA